MKVIVVGASGMVGQGVLRECLLDADVERVLVVGRRALGQTDPKLVERVVPELTDLSAIEADLQGYGACFFCLGVTSVGLTEEAYRKVTYDITAAFVKALAPSAAGMTFVFVSGRGTDGTEKGKVMWARVKGAAENLVLGAGFQAAYAFRPGVIQPLHGIRSRTPAYRILYAAFSPVFGAMKLLSPQSIVTTETMGRAMLEAARRGAPQKLLENRDINALVASRSAAPPAG